MAGIPGQHVGPGDHGGNGKEGEKAEGVGHDDGERQLRAGDLAGRSHVCRACGSDEPCLEVGRHRFDLAVVGEESGRHLSSPVADDGGDVLGVLDVGVVTQRREVAEPATVRLMADSAAGLVDLTALEQQLGLRLVAGIGALLRSRRRRPDRHHDPHCDEAGDPEDSVGAHPTRLGRPLAHDSHGNRW